LTLSLEDIDRQILHERARLKAMLAEQFDPDTGAAARAGLKALAPDAEKTIARLQAGRAELEAQPAPGLTKSEVLALADFAAEVRAGIDAATPAEQRRIYDLLRLRGTVRLAREGEEGYRVGRNFRRFVFEWQAIISIQQHDGGCFENGGYGSAACSFRILGGAGWAPGG
jgi:hypothetical protein